MRSATRISIIKSTLMLGIASFIVPDMAFAQAAQSSDAAVASEASDSQLGDIIVTAQRRAENLQNVPLSVTALNGDALDKNDIRDISRVEVLTPGFTFGRSGSDARPAIRGVRTENVGSSGDPSIGFYVDNIYQSRAAQALQPFVDVQRVEVQRGPQGTLYGRNTFGGNIAITTNAPTENLEAGGSFTYGSYNRFKGEGYVNLPIDDAVQIRAAGLVEKMDGYVKGIDRAHDIYNRDTGYGRVALRIAPPGSGFEALLRYSYWSEKGTGGAAFGYRVGGIFLNPATGAFDLNGQPYLINPKALDGIPDAGGVDRGFPITGGKLQYQGDTILVQRLQQQALNANLSYDFGPVTFRSITGYTEFKVFRNADNDFSPRPLTVDAQEDALHTLSQEFQLASSDPKARLQWILGYFYYDDDIYLSFFSNRPTANRAGTAFTAGLPRTRSNAVFAQASYFIIPDKLQITGGIRYTDDKKTITQANANLDVNERVTDVIPTGRILRFDFDKVTWRAAANFMFSPRNMLYGSVSTGFRSGGFNSGAFTNPAIPGSFAPETVTAYEIGSKNRFFDDRLQFNIAGYINKFSSLQVQNQFLIPNGSGGFTTSSAILNAATATAKGVEVEVQAVPVRHLNVGFTFTYTDAKFDRYVGVPAPSLYTTPPVTAANPTGGFNLSGNRIPYQPDVKVTGLISYDLDMGSFGKITPQVTILYSGAYQLTDFNTVLDRQSAYAQIDLRLGWESSNGRYTAEVFGTNVTDKVVLNRATFGSGGLNQNYGPPAMWGVRVGAKF